MMEPEVTNAETAVVGILIREQDALDEVLGTGLAPEAFTDPFLGGLFARMLSLDAKHERWRLETLGAIVGASGGDVVRLVDVFDKAPIAQNARYFAQEVVRAAWRRNAQQKLMDLVRTVASHDSYESDDALKAAVHSVFSELTTDPLGGTLATPSPTTTVLSLIDEFELMKKHRDAGRIPGITTGLPTLDRSMGGLRRRGLYLIGARPGMGKTTLASEIALAAGHGGYKVAFFTIEMADTQIATKMIGRGGMIASSAIMDADLSDHEEQRFMFAAKTFAEGNVSINDRAGRTIEHFEMECRRLHRMKAIDMAVIDYVQLMRVTGTRFLNRQNEVADISGRLKQLALSLDIPILALVQINREAAKGDIKPPTVAQIRDSGSLEQDADGILLLHRPSYYDQEGDDVLILAKNRFGAPGSIVLNCDMSLNQMTEAE